MRFLSVILGTLFFLGVTLFLASGGVPGWVIGVLWAAVAAGAVWQSA